jgi:hypothetical protein
MSHLYTKQFPSEGREGGRRSFSSSQKWHVSYQPTPLLSPVSQITIPVENLPVPETTTEGESKRKEGGRRGRVYVCTPPPASLVHRSILLSPLLQTQPATTLFFRRTSRCSEQRGTRTQRDEGMVRFSPSYKNVFPILYHKFTLYYRFSPHPHHCVLSRLELLPLPPLFFSCEQSLLFPSQI